MKKNENPYNHFYEYKYGLKKIYTSCTIKTLVLSNFGDDIRTLGADFTA